MADNILTAPDADVFENWLAQKLGVSLSIEGPSMIGDFSNAVTASNAEKTGLHLEL